MVIFNEVGRFSPASFYHKIELTLVGLLRVEGERLWESTMDGFTSKVPT
jgi:hypothetical protein